MSEQQTQCESVSWNGIRCGLDTGHTGRHYALGHWNTDPSYWKRKWEPTPSATPQALCPFCGVVEPCRVHVVAPTGLPATPQPETSERPIVEKWNDKPLGLVIGAVPPDVERLTRIEDAYTYLDGYVADLIAHVDYCGTPRDIAKSLRDARRRAARYLSPSTPGEPT